MDGFDLSEFFFFAQIPSRYGIGHVNLYRPGFTYEQFFTGIVIMKYLQTGYMDGLDSSEYFETRFFIPILFSDPFSFCIRMRPLVCF